MANVLEQKTIQLNVMLVPKSPINIGLIPNSKLETKVAEIYGDSSKPVLTKFPDAFVLFDPNNQIGINVLSDQNRIMISDNRVTPYASRSLDEFIRLTKGAVDIILEETRADGIIAYGFNIMADIDIDQDDSSKFLLEKFIKLGVEGVVCVVRGVRLIFEMAGEDKYRNDLRLDPRFGSRLVPTKSILVSQNSHIEAASLPTLEKLSAQITKIYNELPTMLGKIL